MNSNNIYLYRTLPATQTPMTIKTPKQVIHYHPLLKSALNRMSKKTIPPIVDSYISAPTAWQITQIVAVYLHPKYQPLIMSIQPWFNKDNSNPRIVWNLFLSHSFILSLIQ